MKKIGYLFLMLSISTVSFGQDAQSFQWLVGTWKIPTTRGTIVERWKQTNDSTFTGKSIFVKSSGDSLLQESIEIKFRKGEWSYNPTAIGQNDNKPVEFKMIFIRGTEFISENLTHDFPQRIAYRRIKNQLFASIEGRKNSKYGKQNFDFLED